MRTLVHFTMVTGAFAFAPPAHLAKAPSRGTTTIIGMKSAGASSGDPDWEPDEKPSIMSRGLGGGGVPVEFRAEETEAQAEIFLPGA